MLTLSAVPALLQTKQKFMYNSKTHALILPVITQWTTHFLLVSQMLKVKGAVTSCCSRNENALIICAGKKAKVKDKAEAILAIVGDAGFWANLVK